MEISKEKLIKREYKRPIDEYTVDLYFTGDDLWLSEKQIANLYNVQILTVRRHIRNAYKKGKLEESRVTAIVKDPIDESITKKVYNITAIKNIGHRINSQYVLKLEEWLEEIKKTPTAKA